MPNTFSPDSPIHVVAYLILLRHAKKIGGAGPDAELISREGLDIARDAGVELGHSLASRSSWSISTFHSPLIRTSQTLLAVTGSLGLRSQYRGIINGLGDQQMFDDLVTPEYKEACKTMSNLDAMVAVHNERTNSEWLPNAKSAVELMLNLVAARGGVNVGIGIFHTPTVELAALAVLGDHTPGSKFGANVPELGGYVVQLMSDGSKGITPYSSMNW